MEKLSILDKIKYIFNTIISSNEAKFIIPIIFLVLLMVIISFFRKKDKIKGIYFTIYLLILTSLLIIYHKPIISLLTFLVDTVIQEILYPSMALYAIILVLSNIMLISIILNNNINRFIKGINVMMFTLMQILFVFIIRDIIINNIDITLRLTQEATQGLLIMVEASMFVFVLWSLFLLVTKLIMNVKDYQEDKVIINNYKLNIENNPDLYNKDEFIEYVPIKKVH